MVLMTKTDKDKDKSKFSKMLHDDVEALIANIEAAVKLLEGMMGKANKDRDAKTTGRRLETLGSCAREDYTTCQKLWLRNGRKQIQETEKS